ncbi:hypothetical protein D3C76_1708940 [compost metagenome]
MKHQQPGRFVAFIAVERDADHALADIRVTIHQVQINREALSSAIQVKFLVDYGAEVQQNLFVIFREHARFIYQRARKVQVIRCRLYCRQPQAYDYPGT